MNPLPKVAIPRRGLQYFYAGLRGPICHRAVLNRRIHRARPISATAVAQIEGPSSEHSPGNWRIAPINEPDNLAYAVAIFFSPPSEDDLIKSVMPKKQTVWERARKVDVPKKETSGIERGERNDCVPGVIMDRYPAGRGTPPRR
jgi:hypothetical protein